MKEVPEARPADMAPLHWRHVVHGRRLFCLRSPIQISVGLRDGLSIHECASLGVIAYGASPAESLEAFRADFAACWDSIAQEDDANLTLDAQQLKRTLLALVDCVEEVA